MINNPNKKRAFHIGLLILAAYSMLTYTITNNKILGVITDIISGLAVIGIPVLMLPLFYSKGNKKLARAYLVSRIIEGALMIMGGVFILDSTLEPYRELIYSKVHIYFFILGALFFYTLLYRTQIVPKFISIWGILATLLLFVVTIINLLGFDSMVFQILMLPIILNELFLALWLMSKGLNIKE